MLFEIATDDRHCIRFLSTNDPRFVTPEGISPGSSLEDVSNAGAESPWNEPGWAAHTELPSGWSAGFKMPNVVPYDNIHFGMPTAQSRVDWVFKRGFGACSKP